MRSSFAVLGLLRLTFARVSPFCSAVDSAVSRYHEEQQATSFCSSYLSLSTVHVTSTVTKTHTTITHPISTATATATASPSDVTTGTSTVTETATETATTTTTFASTSTVPLSGCPTPTGTALLKRDTTSNNGPPKPNAFSSYGPSSFISSACSCLSIPHSTQTATRTSVATTTVTRIKTVTVTATTTPVTSVAATITTTTTTTTTFTASTTTTATLINDFAVWATNNEMFGSIVPASGFSASGIAFNTENYDSAYKFGYIHGDIYDGSQSIRSYQQFSGNYYLVTNPGFGVFGYGIGCALDTTLDGNGGCLLSCNCGGSGLFPTASGNTLANEDYGVWTLEGSTNQFLVYAVAS